MGKLSILLTAYLAAFIIAVDGQNNWQDEEDTAGLDLNLRLRPPSQPPPQPARIRATQPQPPQPQPPIIRFPQTAQPQPPIIRFPQTAQPQPPIIRLPQTPQPQQPRVGFPQSEMPQPPKSSGPKRLGTAERRAARRFSSLPKTHAGEGPSYSSSSAGQDQKTLRQSNRQKFFTENEFDVPPERDMPGEPRIPAPRSKPVHILTPNGQYLYGNQDNPNPTPVPFVQEGSYMVFSRELLDRYGNNNITRNNM